MAFGPGIIPPARWRNLDWPESHQRLFAFGHWPDETGPRHPPKNILGYRLHRSWWLATEMRPLMSTHRHVDLPEGRERLAEIEACMTRSQGWCRLGRLHGQRQHLYSARQKSAHKRWCGMTRNCWRTYWPDSDHKSPKGRICSPQIRQLSGNSG